MQQDFETRENERADRRILQKYWKLRRDEEDKVREKQERDKVQAQVEKWDGRIIMILNPAHQTRYYSESNNPLLELSSSRTRSERRIGNVRVTKKKLLLYIV